MSPAFEVLNPETGHRYKIYANGKIEGFDGSMVITNRIPSMIKDMAWLTENYSEVPPAMYGVK
jgi:hypothetical protein